MSFRVDFKRSLETVNAFENGTGEPVQKRRRMDNGPTDAKLTHQSILLSQSHPQETSPLGNIKLSLSKINRNSRPSALLKLMHNAPGSAFASPKPQEGEDKRSFVSSCSEESSLSSAEERASGDEWSESDDYLVLRDALDDALDEEMPNFGPLLDFMDAGHCDLAQADISEIFDCAIVAKHREVLLRSVNLGLTKHERSNLLKYALKKNDLQVAKAAVDGKPGQPPLDFKQWSSNASGLQIALQKELRNDEDMIPYLLSLTSFDKTDFEEIGWRLFLANMWGLDEGHFKLKDEVINYRGAFPWMCDSKISAGILAFQKECPNFLDDDLIQVLRDLVTSAEQGVSVQERLERYKQHKPIKIHGGSVHHQLEVYLWDYILFIADKGLFSEVPIKVYTINPGFVTEQRLKKIMKSNEKFDEERAKEFFTKTLPEKLNGSNFDNTHAPLTDAFTKNWIGPTELDTDTCVTDSLCTFLAGAAAIHAWHKRGGRYDAIPATLKKTNLLVTYLLYNAAEQYLDYSAADPSKMDRSLFERIIQKAKAKGTEAPVNVCGKRLGKNFWKKKAELLEQRFKALSPTRVTLRVKRQVSP